MKIIFILVLLAIAFWTIVAQKDILQVFLVPHSHIDQGWLRTVDEYRADVYTILSSSVKALQQNNDRKFVWGDVLYFKNWFETQPPEVQKLVKYLIKTRRFEFVGGGWIQNDEACPSYTSIIDQMTVGLEYLNERFGIKPKVAWQIDPFGHEGRIPQLYAEMGFETLVINRVHHKIKYQMRNAKALEFLWQMNANINQSIFTHVLHTHYAAIQGFDFENGGIPPINSNNVHQRASEYVNAVRQRATSYKTNFVMVPFGDDFKFKDANLQFSNMDQLIKHINSQYSDIQIRYSTAEEYFEALLKHQSAVEFPIVRHDFVPYADNEDSYWTGYFTSIPNLKKSIRMGEAALQSAESVLAFARLFEHFDSHTSSQAIDWVSVFNSIQKSREDTAVVQHHDSITGTCRTHVSDDYISKMSRAITASKSVEKQMIRLLMEKKDSSNTIREISPQPLDTAMEYAILIHNPISNDRMELISFSSFVSNGISIKDPSGAIVPYQSIPTFSENDKNTVLYQVLFLVHMPGFSIRKYSIQFTSPSDQTVSNTQNMIYFATGYNMNIPTHIQRLNSISELPVLENEMYRVTIQSRGISQLQDKRNGQVHSFANTFMEYRTFRSGSYIFRPQDAPVPVEAAIKYVSISVGPLLSQATLVTNRFTQQITLFSSPLDQQYIKLWHQLEPLPSNTEMISRLSMSGATDSNEKSELILPDGLNFVKRKVNQRAPHAGHFYPSPYGAILQFPHSKQQMIVLVDHTMGVTKKDNHELEFMIHRRLGNDDGRGMNQANNDASSLTFTMLLGYETGKTNSNHWATIAKQIHDLNFPLTSYLVEDDSSYKTQFIPMSNLKPKELHILSFKIKDYASDDIILRLQNWNPIKSVTLQNVYSDLLDSEIFSISNVREKSLSLHLDLPKQITSVHQLRRGFKAGEKMSFDFTADIAKTDQGAQNAEEEGVFLSDEALRLAKEANTQQRKLLSVNEESMSLLLKPSSIRSFVIHVQLLNHEFQNMEQKQVPHVIIPEKKIPQIEPIKQVKQEEKEQKQEEIHETMKKQEEVHDTKKQDEEQPPAKELFDNLKDAIHNKEKYVDLEEDNMHAVSASSKPSTTFRFGNFLLILIVLIFFFLVVKRYKKQSHLRKSGSATTLPMIVKDKV